MNKEEKECETSVDVVEAKETILVQCGVVGFLF